MQKFSPSALAELPLLQNLSESGLNWLVDHGSRNVLNPGDVLFDFGQPIAFLFLLIKGELICREMENDTLLESQTLTSGEVLGCHPFANVHAAGFSVVAVEESLLLSIPHTHLNRMTTEQPELTGMFVRAFINQYAERPSHQLNEIKLITLGKLTSGLTHELSAPSSAFAPSAKLLSKSIDEYMADYEHLLSSSIDSKQFSAIRELLEEKLKSEPPLLPYYQRHGMEEDMADCLETFGVSNGFDYAENYVASGLSPDDIRSIYNIVDRHDLSDVLQWINHQLNIHRTLIELNTSASRIRQLVTSANRYSYTNGSEAPTPVDVNHDLQASVILLAHKARAAKVNIAENYATDLKQVLANPGELNHVWTNLIDNALDALNGSHGSIEIQTKMQDDCVCVAISDNGPGIPEAVQSSIFSKQFSTKKIGQGNGLGLAIVKRILSKHRATIDLDSRPGRTQFTIRFPKWESV